MKNITGKAAAIFVLFCAILCPLNAEQKNNGENMLEKNQDSTAQASEHNTLPANQSEKIDILFTHDIHSWLEKMPIVKTLAEQQRAANPDTIFLDAGDFSMGTVYQTVFSTKAAELSMLGEIGVDVTTLGNHEFDYGADKLSEMLHSALKSGKKLPAISICNVDWNTTDITSQTIKKALVDDYGASDYVMIKKGQHNIAVIGVFGDDALYCAPSCPLSILDQAKSVKKTVQFIKEHENADFIVCISHSGTNPNKSKSEDEILAKKVPELDLIISGHTHTTLEKPIICGNTIIASCGCYLNNLGYLSVEKQSNGRWKVLSYNLLPVDSSIPADPEMQNQLSEFKKDIDSDYFSLFGYTGNTILTQNNLSFHLIEEYQTQYTDKKRADEKPLVTIGQLAVDSFYNLLNSRSDLPQVEVTVVPAGVIRGLYDIGGVSVNQVYQSFSLGIGKDGIPGYPLIYIYLTGKELKAICEIDATVSHFMPTAILFMSGLSYSWNSNRLPFDRVVSVFIEKDGTKVPADDNKLYSVATDLYTGKMLSNLLKQTLGLISIKPKDNNGNAVNDISDAIIYTADNRELKAWQAIAMNLETIPEIPSKYTNPLDYKVKEDSLNPLKVFSKPSKAAAIVYFTGFLLFAIIAFIVIFCIKHKKNKKTRK